MQKLSLNLIINNPNTNYFQINKNKISKPKLKQLNNISFEGGGSFVIHPSIKSRINELGILNMQNPSGIKIYRRLSNLIPFSTTDSFVMLANRLTFNNNEELDCIIVDKFEELLEYAKQNKSSKSISEIVEYTLKCFKSNKKQTNIEFLPKIMSFIKSNFDFEGLNEAIELCRTEDQEDINPEKFNLYKNFSTEKLPQHYKKIALKSSFSGDVKYWINYQKLSNLTLSKEDAIILTNLIYEKNITAEYLEDFFYKALERRNVLESFEKKVDENDLKKLLFSNPRKTLGALEFLGEKTFLYSFIDKYKRVKENIQSYGDLGHHVYYQNILEIINPLGSKKYKDAIQDIRKLKKGFNDKTPEEKKQTIEEINKNNLIIKNILENSVKDPQDALKIASIYKTLWKENPNYVEKILPYLIFKNDETQKNLYKILNEIIIQNMGIKTKIDSRVSERLNFANSRHFHTLFETEHKFNCGLQSILNLLCSYPELSTAEIFNLLPQNKETRKLFEENGINYDNWVNYNPKSSIEYNLETDIENARKEAIRNLENDLNDINFAYIPNYVINDLKESLEKGGYLLEDISLDFDNSTKKLYKINKTPIEYKDLKPIIDIIIDEIIKKDFWKTPHEDKSTENAKQLIKNRFIGSRNNEIKKLARNKSTKNQIVRLKIQKTDMNNIENSLFIGNDAACCSGVGKTREWTAPSYVINKFISCIEVNDDRQCIGNTMCFIAKVDGVPSLILDNIEIKQEYQYNETIKHGIINYAKKLCSELGKPDMPIYIGPNRNKLHLEEYERILKENVQILGSSGYTEVYLDFYVMPLKLKSDKKFKTILHKIR